MKRNLFLNLLFFILISNTYSQQVVIDSITRAPIESAHVSYGANGLITNENGLFEISNQENIDSLYITHISYQPKKISLLSLKKGDTITLEKASIVLDEVILKKFQAKDTIHKAINKIEKNYLTTPHNLYGFFRQSLKEDSKGVEMVEVDFISYFENKKDAFSTKIINSRRTDNYSEINFETIGGVFSVIEKGDFVSRKVYFLDSNIIDNYVYKYRGEIEYQGTEVYVISVSPKDKNDLRYIREGLIHVDKKSLAFVEINYHFNKEKLNILTKNAKSSERKKRETLSILRNVENIIRYRQNDKNKWALSSIEANSSRLMDYKNKEHIYSLKAKLVINNVKTDNATPVKTNYNLSKDFSKAIRRFDDLKGWNDNYKLSLSDDEKNILKEINSHIKK